MSFSISLADNFVSGKLKDWNNLYTSDVVGSDFVRTRCRILRLVCLVKNYGNPREDGNRSALKIVLEIAVIQKIGQIRVRIWT